MEYRPDTVRASHGASYINPICEAYRPVSKQKVGPNGGQVTCLK